MKQKNTFGAYDIGVPRADGNQYFVDSHKESVSLQPD